ncbi:hypothetical protein ACFL0Z_00595 [Patescibacteria group bacterium]
MNGNEIGPNKPPEEYGAEHFEDPMHQQIKESWFKKLLANKKLLFIIAAVVVAALIITLVIIFSGSRGTYSDQKVWLEIEGSDSVASGSEVTYRLNAINKEEVALNDVEIEIIFPEGFVLNSSTLDREDPSRNIWQLGTIPENHSQDFEVTGTLDGTAGDLKLINGIMRFVPEGLGAKYEKKGETSTVIATGDVTLTVDAPQNVVSGNEIEYLVRYQNRSRETVSGIYIQATYPSGFTFLESDPNPTDGNTIWKLPDLDGNEQGEIKIKGRLTGVKDDTKRVKVEIGTKGEDGSFYSQLTKEDTTRIVESALVISQGIMEGSEIVNPGEDIILKITYENLGNVELRNAEIDLTLSNPDIIDFGHFNAPGGSLEDNNHKITWISSGIPGLELIKPNDKGEIEVRFRIKDRALLPVDSVDDKNFSLATQAALISEDIPVSVSIEHKVESPPIEFKVSSYITVDAQGFYYDQMTGSPVGEGPMPPKVNQTTKYHIIWTVTNLANDLEDAEVSVVLAPGVKWENNATVTHGEDLNYNAKTGKIIWKIGQVPANIGTVGEKMAASFDISITPGADKVGSEVNLLQESQFSATDTFTGVELEGVDESLDTNLPDDVFAKDQGQVQP